MAGPVEANDDDLRTGVIGAGMIARIEHIPNRIHLHGAELVERPAPAGAVTGKQA